ncbi:hypothetical protein AURDEDRAFT_117417 [Auricularia subglabra TFB-10046 SS5]|uniref:Uncharacterized protein n=1 Tax=Auricularia subglabra (strain TFB-10046 / SS5) TaxID=717982 RepID=J0WSX9_AURST|nr:hypothetical protein AURDEDRAFT_117417 [Auricularia subglabra TFB-10046 SS5]
MFVLPAALVALASTALAAPTHPSDKRTDISSIPSIFSQLHAFDTSSQVISLTNNAIPPFSFNNWGGLSSLNLFDDFFGVGNFDGRFNSLNFIVDEFQQINVLQCSVVDISFVQQNIAILIEVMKQLLLTQICDVETQIILASQFGSRWLSFIDDLRHISGRNVGFDSFIASQLQVVIASLGGSHVDLGFLGSSIGSQLQFVSSNFNQDFQLSRLQSAWSAAQLALLPPSLVGF